ncbi:Src substrate cortactin [Camelus dromedarius]|uniref:Src substrate cortactin n=1 Tax=Camelus dromedarius TaxID=9838 RepID=A0A5N4DW14_CAMDR|nr:Src substrate cortactin [Camelus dromedarius]
MTVHKLRENVFQEYEPLKEKELETEPKASCGYGGKLSVEQDSMDKSAVHHEYQSKLSKHYLQVDPNQGFGSKFGIQVDRVDQLAVGFEYQGKTGKHASQKDYSSGLGGKYGPAGQPWGQERDGLRLQGKTEKHGLQKDYSRSLRGKNGIDQARQTRVLLAGITRRNCSCMNPPKKHYIKGSGREYGAQKDGTSKKASPFEDVAKVASSHQKAAPVEAVNSRTSIVGADWKPRDWKPREGKTKRTRRQAEVERAGKEEKRREIDAYDQCESDLGITAIALRDPQAAGGDEVSFHPDDIITYVAMMDDSWWRGLCHGRYWLFPANY